MNVILGASGHTGSIIADFLLSKGEKVRVMGREPGRLERFVRKGAEAFTANLDFLGNQTRELLGERDLSMTEATAVIARGIGKPDLRYEQFPLDQVQQVLTRMGIPPTAAAVYIEMYKAINAGVVAPQEPRSPENSTPTSFEEFVQEVFAPAYHGKALGA